MEWYGPLTVLPAIGLLILSTARFIVSLNSEIFSLQQENTKNKEIILSKLRQLKKLGIANSFLYASALLFLLAGMLKALTSSDMGFYIIMFTGLLTTTIGLSFLFIHSLKSTQIRQKHLKL